MDGYLTATPTHRTENAKQRISSAALCIINDAHGRYLLGVNKARAAYGKHIYMPIGGALRYYDPALLDSFGAVPEKPGKPDLRVYIKGEAIESYREWFYSRDTDGREVTPFRELREEFVDEYRVLDSLQPVDVEMRFLHVYEGQATTDRNGSTGGALTTYLHDIFQVRFTSEIVRQRIEYIAPESGLRRGGIRVYSLHRWKSITRSRRLFPPI